MAGEDHGWLDEADWAAATASLPIACVDIVPVRRRHDGTVTQVGLILRGGPTGPVWCHIGGRVLRNEAVTATARRHLEATVEASGPVRIAGSPFHIHEFFTDPREESGWDPRKHAISLCFIAEVPEDVALEVRAAGEATDFTWVSVDDVLSMNLVRPSVRHR